MIRDPLVNYLFSSLCFRQNPKYFVDLGNEIQKNCKHQNSLDIIIVECQQPLL